MRVCFCACSRACVCVRAPVRQRGDDQSVGVPQVLVAELELGVADVDVALPAVLVPAVAQLGQPRKLLPRRHLGNPGTPGGGLKESQEEQQENREDQIII